MNKFQQLESEGLRVQIGHGIRSSYRAPSGIVIGGSHRQCVCIGDGHIGYSTEDRSWQGQDDDDSGGGFMQRIFGRR